jgi:hypothetical protein
MLEKLLKKFIDPNANKKLTYALIDELTDIEFGFDTP